MTPAAPRLASAKPLLSSAKPLFSSAKPLLTSAKPLLTSAGSSWAVSGPIRADCLSTSSLLQPTGLQLGPTGWHIDYEPNIRKRERSLFFPGFSRILPCSGFCNLDATWNQLGINYCSLRDNLESLGPVLSPTSPIFGPTWTHFEFCQAPFEFCQAHFDSLPRRFGLMKSLIFS